MSFAEPERLWLLFLVPLSVLFLNWARHQRRRALAQLGDPSLLTRLSALVDEKGRRRRIWLWLLGITLIVLALAQPQWGSEVQIVSREGVQIMVVLDVSTSMLAQDLQPSRLTRAKQSVVELMGQLDGDEIGLVLFSGASFIQFPLTSDYGTARSFLNSAQPGIISRPGSRLGEALATAHSGFDAERAVNKVIVVLTDGESHDDDPVAVAAAAAEEGMIIFAIGYGSGSGEPIPEYGAAGQLVGYKKDSAGEVILSRLDEGMLQRVTRAGNGRYFRATASGQEIEQLAAELAQLQASQLQSQFRTTPIERFQFFLALAILCLLAAELTPERRRRPRRQQPIVLLLLLGVGLSACAPAAERLIASGNEAFADGQYVAALTAYDDALAVTPDLPEAEYNAANTLYRQGDIAAALARMEQALLLANGDLAQNAFYNQGNFYYDQANYAAAVEAYKDALRLHPEDTDAKHNLELALQQLAAQQEEAQEEDSTTPDTAEEQPPVENEESDAEGEQSDGSEEETADQPPAGDQEMEDANADGPELESRPQELTAEQARQLLDGIAQTSETLQERQQRLFVAPGREPEKDW